MHGRKKFFYFTFTQFLKVHRYLQRNATGFYLVYTRLVFLKCHKDKGFWAIPSVFILSDSFFCFSDEEALKLIEKDSAKSGSRKKDSSTWQERDMGSILHAVHNTIV